ncbi:TPA: hypothetical protein DEO28_04125 [Candidatus Dependentiae bacterium]|nr:MAG: hypothetical protein UR14_C0006G0062 [candidate division TM6 bacterium GW2011_GWE2_31_21]KKP53515.1 MAG: hypothetical protein UR43_C0004G0056 [candidate division TM6 bacterium GW2011_GWF2_33_332]HBS48244.1 hypothetical protein [Candidatus Dependentiae bacterium]HBZ73670.1 hypothetical protein [Candidatus Dependentiae bacterium]
MILARYISKRFFIYFSLVNCGLTLLFNFIEFFEKFSQLQNVTNIEILHFILLNLIPTFFDLFPLACWIATCLLIRDLYQKNEFTNLHVLGIKSNKLLPALFACGLSLSIIGFFGKELISRPIANKSENFKLQHLKKKSNKVIYNQWFLPTDNLFAYFQIIDQEKSTANNILFLFFNEKFELEKKIESKLAVLSPIDHKVFIPNANILNFKTNNLYTSKLETFYLPGLFTHLQMHKLAPSIKRQAYNLSLIYRILPYETFNLELGKLISKILGYFQPLLYILLTFCLFFLTPQTIVYRWLLIFSAYPLFLVINSIADFSLQHNSPFWVVIIPYLLVLIFLIIFRFTIFKK